MGEPKEGEVFVSPGDVDVIALAATNTKGAAMNAVRLCSSLKLDIVGAQQRQAEAVELLSLIDKREDERLPFLVPAELVTAAMIGTGFEIGKVKLLRGDVVKHRIKSTQGVDQQIKRLNRLLGDLGGEPEVEEPKLELEPAG